MRTSSPGPPGRADAAQWRRWVFPAALAAGLVTLLVLPRGAAPGMALSYTKFLADVSAGTVRAVTISPAGQVTGSLAGGHPFTTTIPVALGGNGLAGGLAAHHVQVTATTAMSSSLLSVLIGLLPLLLFGGLLYLGIRRVPPAVRRRPRRAGRPGQGEGAGHRRRMAGHPVHRRGRVPHGEDRDQRGRRLSARPGPLAPGRGPRPARGADGRAAWYRQDAAGPRGRWRGPRSLPFGVGLGFRGDVRRPRGGPGPGPVRAGPHPKRRRSCSSTRSMPSAPAAIKAAWPTATSGSRPSTSCSPRWTGSRTPAGSWCWPPPTGRTPWTPRCAVPAGSTARSSSRCPAGPNGPPSWPPTPAARTSARTPTWTRSPPPRPDSPARTWPAWSTRPPSPRSGAAAPPWRPRWSASSA